MNLVDLHGDTLRHARNGCILITACGHDHLIGCEGANIRRDFEGVGIVSMKPCDRYLFVDWWVEGARVRFDVGNNLILLHKSMRVGSGIGVAG